MGENSMELEVVKEEIDSQPEGSQAEEGVKKRPPEKEEIKSKAIGFSGKGGTGKTTLAALSLRALKERNSPSLLAVDSDPNMCLPEVLGVENYQPLSSIIGEVREKGPKEFSQKFASLLLKNEQEGYDLLPMGRTGDEGCYCPVNNYLRRAMETEVLKGDYAYDYIVIDCEAGLEHISRKTSAPIDDLVIVTDDSKMGLNTVDKIQETGERVKIDVDEYYVVANRVEDEEILGYLEEELSDEEATFLGNIPEDKYIRRYNFRGKSLLELPANSPAYQKVEDFIETIL